nr:DUF3604 domain-containing protein [Methyloceanibacter methanicus]
MWDKYNLAGVPKEPGMIEYEYARQALKRGLKLEAEFGTNPFKFGLIGSTDDHTGISSAEENNFFGKFPASEPSPERSTGNAFDFDGNTVKDWQLGASGLTAVWAPENTRASIWDAMKRKEVYGTTGTRMFVRFFGGWDSRRRMRSAAIWARLDTARACPWAATFRRRRKAAMRRHFWSRR